MKERSFGGTPCVWIVDDANLLLHGHDLRHSLEVIIPPASDNRTLQAQEGLFMCQRLSTDDVSNFDAVYQPTPFESILAEAGVNRIIRTDRGCPAYPKFLLHKIRQNGYDGSRLFPGFEGAAQAVRGRTTGPASDQREATVGRYHRSMLCERACKVEGKICFVHLALLGCRCCSRSSSRCRDSRSRHRSPR